MQSDDVAMLALRVDDVGNAVLDLPERAGQRGLVVTVRRRGNWVQINVTVPQGRRLEVRRPPDGSKEVK